MSNKLLAVLLGVWFVLVLGMGGGMYMIWHKLAVISAQAAPPEAEKKDGNAEFPPIGKIISLDTFIVNLADPGGARYLRLTMDLEVSGEKTVEEEMTRRVPQLRDAVLMILPTKRYADISTTEGKTALRDELMASLNGLIAAGKITRIYFKEFVIQ